MKSTKATKVKPAASREEECGIWLDAAELKEKKQKQMTRPISKLLNPLARSGGYSVAVALSFTQTKLNMPPTRQSTISSFFTPKPRDPNPSATHVGMYTVMHTDAKRKHGVTLEPFEGSDFTTSQTSEVYKQNCDLDEEDVSAKESDDRKEQSFLHLMCGNESDEDEPPEKRRAFADYTDHYVLETQECWNKEASVRSRIPNDIQTIPDTETLLHGESQGLDPLMASKPPEEACGNVPQSPCPKDLHTFKDNHVLREQISTIEGPILPSRHVNAEHRTANAFAITTKDQVQSCYKPKASSMKLIGKENSPPASPIHNVPLSPLKQKLTPSPAKSRLNKKYTLSLKKSSSEFSGTAMAGDSFAMLFTQDSEGFCVIAHRDQNQRSPLKDRTNASVGKDYSPSVRPLEEEEESDAEMLFTQDSEGNLVIKH